MENNQQRREWLQREPNHRLSRVLKWVTWTATVLVFILVGLMSRPEIKVPLPDGVDFGFLPPIHAVLNTCVAVLLVLALLAVKAGNIRAHRNLIVAAMGVSVLFLLGYVAYHLTNAEIKFGDSNLDGVVDSGELAAVGSLRSFYLILLLTHIVAAGVSLPLILLTFTAGWTNRFQAHRNLARWVFPLWLYVAVTGPICYLMLRPYYP
jgi:putative membrane protein